MKNAKWNSIDEFDDISTKDQYQIAREAGLSDREARERIKSKLARRNNSFRAEIKGRRSQSYRTGLLQSRRFSAPVP